MTQYLHSNVAHALVRAASRLIATPTASRNVASPLPGTNTQPPTTVQSPTWGGQSWPQPPFRRLLLPLTIALLTTITCAAAVDGTVTNATTNKPQPGATVTLFQTSSQGPQFIDSVKTDAAGHFSITKELPANAGGPVLLQAVYAGVQYNDTIPPGQPTTGIAIPVYESSKQQPAGVKVSQHIMLLEPSGGTVIVAEVYDFQNDGKTAWNNPDSGTLQFSLPAAAQGKVEVNVLAPGGLPIRRAADPAGKPNTFKVDFPIKPGQSEVRMEWAMPFNPPAVFDGAILAKNVVASKVLAPAGVTLSGDGVTALGQEPTTGGTYYSVEGAAYHIKVEGTGTLKPPGAENAGDANNGQPAVSENMPKLYNLTLADGTFLASFLAVKWVIASIIGMLAIGFVLLYRKGNPHDGDRS